MSTFEEFQALAVKAPVSLRHNRDRINLPLGLQEDAGKIGALLSTPVESGDAVGLEERENFESVSLVAKAELRRMGRNGFVFRAPIQV